MAQSMIWVPFGLIEVIFGWVQRAAPINHSDYFLYNMISMIFFSFFSYFFAKL